MRDHLADLRCHRHGLAQRIEAAEAKLCRCFRLSRRTRRCRYPGAWAVSWTGRRRRSSIAWADPLPVGRQAYADQLGRILGLTGFGISGAVDLPLRLALRQRRHVHPQRARRVVSRAPVIPTASSTSSLPQTRFPARIQSSQQGSGSLWFCERADAGIRVTQRADVCASKRRGATNPLSRAGPCNQTIDMRAGFLWFIAPRNCGADRQGAGAQRSTKAFSMTNVPGSLAEPSMNPRSSSTRRMSFSICGLPHSMARSCVDIQRRQTDVVEKLAGGDEDR